SDCSHRKISIAFVTRSSVEHQKEITAAYSFLTDHTYYDSKKISFEEIAQNSSVLSDLDLVWIHDPDTGAFSESGIHTAAMNAIEKYIHDQGNLLLTQNAFTLLPDLGLEHYKPQITYIEVKDQGYGRKRGFHAFRSHPIFNKMYGGAYVFNPHSDTLIRQAGYFRPRKKVNGKTVAVDRAYIRLKEDKRLILEYSKGNGKIISIGSYINFSTANYNQQHLELFFHNVIGYVTDTIGGEVHYWHQDDNTVQKFSSDTDTVHYPDSFPWKDKKSEMVLTREKAADYPWDMSGQRMVIMGKEKAGIEEIWVHPVMALRDYETGYRFSSDEDIQWLSNKNPEISLDPHAFSRIYTIGESRLTETITADITDPVGVIHYDYSGENPLHFYVRFKSNLRYMWPYSSRVFSTLYFDWNRNGNYYIIKDDSGDFSSIIGTNKVPRQHIIGQFDSVSLTNDQLTGIPGSTFQVYAMSEFLLQSNDSFDVVISSSNQGVKQSQDYYSSTIKEPYSVYISSYNYYQNFLENKLSITSPDREFNNGFKWALIGTDKFFVHTPGIGKSLVAGYATTAKGWDGGHKVNGRPGYAWYFGRDGEWSGFALNDYGDFEKVKYILRQYLDFQDISGKIYHELTTSGVVHYDASDANPLFLILAGDYLHHSGDKKFIRSNWEEIKKAIDYCYSTDTDNDKLIENTNVGHGWVEGGHLYGGKSTLYLASCWAAALKQASYMAEVCGFTSESQRYKEDHDTVVHIINQQFWNDRTRFFNHSINEDGTFKTEVTVMPTIPLYFNQIQEYSRTQSVLDRIASNNFSSNWGVRIVSEASDHFNPRGYHTGSVWPLFTGWTALAEYKNYKPAQGFQHIMDNLMIYKNWSLGYIEEVLHGAVCKPSGVCGHQCWSETMVIQPIIEGMLGIQPSAPDNTLLFSPSLPFQWNEVAVENIRVGDSFLHINMIKEDKKIIYWFLLDGQNKLQVDFIPVLPPTTRINSVTVNGKKYEYNLDNQSCLVIPEIDFIIQEQVLVEIRYQGGVFAIPDINPPESGDSAEGLRVISENVNNNSYKMVLGAPSGTSYTLNVFLNHFKPKKVINAVIKGKNNNTYTLGVCFEEASGKYLKKEVVVEF
ncbi:MAG: GH116 family glycosyl hydrolase, partial [bacterium]